MGSDLSWWDQQPQPVTDPWPQPFGTWIGGGEYPSRQAPRPLTGWVCSGCGTGLAPQVRECPHCQPKASDSCQSPREGGMCSCGEGG